MYQQIRRSKADIEHMVKRNKDLYQEELKRRYSKGLRGIKICRCGDYFIERRTQRIYETIKPAVECKRCR
jgi:hypothetical protein